MLPTKVKSEYEMKQVISFCYLQDFASKSFIATGRFQELIKVLGLPLPFIALINATCFTLTAFRLPEAKTPSHGEEAFIISRLQSTVGDLEFDPVATLKKNRKRSLA
ncbi:hypothetical protein NC651_013257 [Populus alba x Populus x berolinensis]|nr:hypothetical protein NC651_013257 [Populus alba x Populus x berolinensis]